MKLFKNLLSGIILSCLTLIPFFSFSQNNIPDFISLPDIKWEFKINAQIFASPVINKDRIYIGGLDSILHVIDINNGKELWSFRTNGEIRSNACIDKNNIYLNGGDGNLYAIEEDSGKVLWIFKTKGERNYDFADYFHSTPVIYNNTIYFGSGDGYLYAINAENGGLIWSYQTGDIIHTTPAIDRGKVFFGSFDGFVYALNLTDGNLIWKFKTVGHRYFPKGEVQGSPTAFGKLVFIGARDYNIYAIDQEKGFCHWNKSFTRGWGLNNNIYDSVLYIGSADERVLIAANPFTGKEFWNVKMEFLVFGNNAYTENLMYLGTTIGKLHGINRKNGEKIWSFETDSYLNARFKYFKPDDTYRDDIYSIIKSNEQFLEVECELGGIFSTPYISEKLIIFSSTNGKVYCLSR